MVLGLGSKKKGATVKVEFQIQLQEIKPWRVDSASSASVPLLVHWQRGDSRSGRTKGVLPKQEDGGKLVFNDTFRLPAKLVRDPPPKGRNAGLGRFQKKTIVFILQEATTDQQLGRCVLDLAEYGDAHSSVAANIPMALGKKNATGPTPTLFLTIGPLGKEERSFTARVSFGASTPRNSISKAPEKTISGKSKAEPVLDEDTRRSIVASLMSDEEDNMSIESFTDDEGTPPDDSTPRSRKTSEPQTPEREMPKASTLPPKAEIPKEIPKRPTPVMETVPKPVTKSSSSSSSSSSSVQAEAKTEGPPTNITQQNRFTANKPVPSSPMRSAPEAVPTNETVGTSRNVPPKQAPGRPAETSTISSPETSRNIPLKQAPGRAAETPTISSPETSRNIPPKQAPGRAAETSTISSSPENPKSSPPPPAAAPSVTQLFSSVPVYKSSKGAEDLAAESAPLPAKTVPSKPGPSVGSESQASKVVKPQPLAEQRDGVPPRRTLAADVSSNGGGSMSRANKSTAPFTPERPQIAASKVPDRTSSSRSSTSAESKRPGELLGIQRPHSSITEISAKKELSQEIATPSTPGPAKKAAAAVAAAAAAASAASGYGASRPYRSFESSSHDYLSEASDDSLSESSTSGRSPAHTPLRDPPSVSGRSLPSKQAPVDAKRSETSALASNIGTTVPLASDEKRDEKRDEGKTPQSKSPEAKKEIEREAETKRAAAEKLEESGEQGESILGTARANLARMEKRALEELRTKVANAEAKLLAENQKVEQLQGELRDLGAMEVSLYTVVAEHGNSTQKLHTPARRLARLYMHAHKNWSSDRRAGTVKNSVSGLVTVAKSCGSDVSRLSFWWSNVVALRAVITQAYDKGLSKGDKPAVSPGSNTNGNGSPGWARARRSVGGSSFARRASGQALPTTPSSPAADWKEASSYIAALEKIEDWIYSKIVESLWWQAMMPRMQRDVDASTPTSPKGMAMLSPSPLFASAKEDLSKLAGESGIFVKKPSKRSISLPELGDSRQGTVSVEVWKKAILEALRRLCPVRGAGHDCGCLPMLIKMAIEGCVARLDVALFNAILRDPEDDVPTDPYSDPVSDSSVLPIAPGGLTFGGGSQLKNVVVTWSTFIASLVNVKDPVFVTDSENGDNTDTSEDSDQMPRFFHLIKATGDLLMLPKEILMDKGIRKEEARPEAKPETRPEVETNANVFVMLRTTGDILQLPKDLLMDKSLRREICPMLSLPLIRRVLLNFVPDEFAPDPISPSLLAALNAEASIEKQRQGEAESFSSSTPMAAAPPIVYVAPTAENVWPWIGEAGTDPNEWGRSNNSLLRKGYTSDEDLSVMEQLQKSSASNKLEILLGTSILGTANGKHPADAVSPKRIQSPGALSGGSRFELLKEVWGVP